MESDGRNHTTWALRAGGTTIVCLVARCRASRTWPLLRGAARFVDDIELPGLLHVALLRSPVAHARLRAIDAAKARAVAGVHAVLTFADLRPLLTADRSAGNSRRRDPLSRRPFPLARDEICYVGEPVALVVAQSRAIAEDAAALIELDTEPLPAVLDPRAGLAPGAPRARLDCPDNLVARHLIDYGDVEGAFARAAHRIAERFRLDKGGGHSIETRGVLAASIPSTARSPSGPTPRCRTVRNPCWSRARP